MHITMYDSVDDMFEDLDRAMQAADANVKDWQKAIKKGDCFWQDTEYGFQVYGEVLKNAYKEERLQHYRLCRCYSEACPDGEMGDVHLSVIGGLLTKEEFEEKIKAL